MLLILAVKYFYGTIFGDSIIAEELDGGNLIWTSFSPRHLANYSNS